VFHVKDAPLKLHCPGVKTGRLQNYQADFHTKGDFKVSIFNLGDSTMASVASGSIGETSIFVHAADVLKLRELIAGAKSTLDSVRASN
jgi:hypothetical protein